MNPRRLLLGGIALLLAGLLVPEAIHAWLRTRSKEPVNVAPEFSSGKNQTVQFKINLPGTYWVQIEFADFRQVASDECSPTRFPHPTWTMERLPYWYERNSENWASSGDGFVWENAINLDRFYAPEAEYRIHVTYPKGMDCLNTRSPRLVIRSDDFEFHEGVEAVIGLVLHYLAVVGAACVPWAGALWLRKRIWKEDKLVLFPGVVPRNHLPLLRHERMPLISFPSNFGLICGTLSWILVFIFMMAPRSLLSHGLPIRLRTHDAVVWQKSPWQETLSVYIDANRKYYVNGQLVPRESLRSKLKEQLSHRLVWSVYFEADKDALTMDALYAIDVIQGVGGNVVWITPETRKDFERAGLSYADKR